jgi:hypothetical protein
VNGLLRTAAVHRGGASRIVPSEKRRHSAGNLRAATPWHIHKKILDGVSMSAQRVNITNAPASNCYQFNSYQRITDKRQRPFLFKFTLQTMANRPF